MSRNISFILPKLCEHYEFKLVEEIALWPHPATAHYGKVCVIGLWEKQESIETDLLYSLNYGNSSLSLRDKTVHVPLVFQSNYPLNTKVRPNEKVEVNGELFFRKRLPNGNFGYLIHSRHLMIQLQQKQMMLEAKYNVPRRRPTGLRDQSLHSSVKVSLLKLADTIKDEYKPVIQVQTMSNVKNTKELIVVNLETRIIRQRQNSLNS